MVWLADFDLEGLKNRLDEQGLAVAENQELSLKSRRKLAETTRGAFSPCSLSQALACQIPGAPVNHLPR